MTSSTVTLKTLVRGRHWKYSTFCTEYDRAARRLDPGLVGSWPSRAQYQRWLTGDLKRLPYPDACRVLEAMFPGWSVDALFHSEPVEQGQLDADLGSEHPGIASIVHPATRGNGASVQTMRLVTSGGDLRDALVDVARNAQQLLVATGSRSCEVAYLQEIESSLLNKPELVHYRILFGAPHNEVFKDHLLRLLDLADHPMRRGHQRVHISIRTDLARDPERFFVANESSAVVLLPSANSPRNFDTGLIVGDMQYTQALVQHGKALYGAHKLESVQAVEELEVLG